MKVSNESRSFELRPRFFVSLNPDIERQHIIFPNFQTYVAPLKDEVHNETPLTEAEIKSLADRERVFQKVQKERLEAEREEAKRQRALARINKL